jgi:hypothetical protein
MTPYHPFAADDTIIQSLLRKSYVRALRLTIRQRIRALLYRLPRVSQIS